MTELELEGVSDVLHPLIHVMNRPEVTKLLKGGDRWACKVSAAGETLLDLGRYTRRVIASRPRPSTRWRLGLNPGRYF